MKIKLSTAKQMVTAMLVVVGLGAFAAGVVAQPVVSYTVSGVPGNYTLNFTLNNTTPGTAGFDIYYFGVLANGSISGSPAGNYFSDFQQVHQLEVGDVFAWTFNHYWIDPTYTYLPTGRTVSGFTLLDTDATAPSSIPYFAYGENNGLVYTGGENHNLNNPSNPLFVGYAVQTVPEPAAISLLTFGSLWLWFGKRRPAR